MGACDVLRGPWTRIFQPGSACNLVDSPDSLESARGMRAEGNLATPVAHQYQQWAHV